MTKIVQQTTIIFSPQSTCYLCCYETVKKKQTFKATESVPKMR